MLIHIRKALHAPDIEIGYLFLRLAWRADGCAWISSRKKTAIDFIDILEGTIESRNKAREYRLEAIKYFEKSNEEKDKIILVDLYRRTDQFEKEAELLAKEVFPNEYQHIIKQQRELIDMKDDEAHLIEKDKT